MTLRAEQFWIKGPPAGLRESIIGSGLVKDSKIAAQVNIKHPKTAQIRMTDDTLNRLSATKTAVKPRRKLSYTSHTVLEPMQRTNPQIAASNSCTFAEPPKRQPPDEMSPFPYPSENVLVPIKTPFEEALLTEKTATEREQSQDLLKKFNKILEELEYQKTQKLTPTQQAENYSNTLNAYYMLWNDVILKIKGYNKDYSMMLIQIKDFFQELLEKLPKLAKSYEKRLAEMQDQQNGLRQIIDQLNTQCEEYKRDIEIGQDKFVKMNNTLTLTRKQYEAENVEKTELLIRVEELKNKTDEATYRVGKLQEMRKTLEGKIEEYVTESDDLHNQIHQYEALVEKYEEEGAGFRPMYQKASEELNELKRKYEELEAELAEYKAHEAKSDIGTDPVWTITDSSTKNKSDGGKKGRARQISQSKNHLSTKKGDSVHSSVESFKLSDLTGSQSALRDDSQRALLGNDSIAEISSDGSQILMTEMQLELPKSQEPSKPATPLDLAKRNENNKSNESIASVKSTKSTHSKDGEDKNINADQKEQTPAKEQTETPEAPPEQEQTVVEDEVFANIVDKLPPDYNPDEYIISQADTMVTYVYTLLPKKYDEYNIYAGADAFQLYAIPKDVQLKPFSWTLRYVITILRDGFEQIKSQTDDITFKAIIENVMMESHKNDAVVRRIEASLMTSVVHFRKVSKTMDFFIKFVIGEFSVTNFKFFNMLFSSSFSSIFPRVETITNDPDVEEDANAFTIHLSNCNRLATMFLKMNTLPKSIALKLVRMAPDKNYPMMVSFWDFATEMIYLFNSMHKNFHTSIRNCFKLVGVGDVEKIVFDNFVGFCLVIMPDSTDKSIKELWKTISLTVGEMNAYYIEYPYILQYFGENQAIVEAILSLPKNDAFDNQFKVMVNKNDRLYQFMKNRYISYIPQLKAAIKPVLLNKIMKFIFNIRNQMLKCDLSEAFMYYRHILQTVDLSITQANPYYIFPPTMSMSDVETLLNSMKAREKVTYFAVNVDLADDMDKSESSETLNPADAQTSTTKEGDAQATAAKV